MKFVLEESVKHILNERFVLDEADNGLVSNILQYIQNARANLKGRFPAVIADTESSVNTFTSIRNIESALKEIENSKKAIDTAKTKLGGGLLDIKKLITGTDGYIEHVNKFLQAIDKYKNIMNTHEAQDFKRALTTFENDAKDQNVSKKYLLDELQRVHDNLTLFKNKVRLDQKIGSLNSIVDKCAKIERMLSDKIPAKYFVSGDILKAAEDADAQEYFNAVKNLTANISTISKLKSVKEDSKIDARIALFDKFMSLSDALGATLIAEQNSDKDAYQTSQKADWEALYSECNTPEEFEMFWHGKPNAAKRILQAGYFKAE